jgi:hypothetical protein
VLKVRLYSGRGLPNPVRKRHKSARHCRFAGRFFRWILHAYRRSSTARIDTAIIEFGRIEYWSRLTMIEVMRARSSLQTAAGNDGLRSSAKCQVPHGRDKFTYGGSDRALPIAAAQAHRANVTDVDFPGDFGFTDPKRPCNNWPPTFLTGVYGKVKILRSHAGTVRVFDCRT